MKDTKHEQFGVHIDDIHRELTRMAAKKFKLTLDEMKVMTVEELYKVIMQFKPNMPKQISQDLGSSSGSGDDNEPQENPSDGKMVQEGDPELYKEGLSDREREDVLKENIVKAYATQKTCGSVPAELKRIVDRMLASKINWRSIVKSAFVQGMGKTVVGTYKKPSRKNPMFPGIQRFTYPTVHFLVDTSGSMGQNELAQALGEIYGAAKNSPVIVTPWDGEAYESTRVSTQSEVLSKASNMMRGGGGTVIGPALQKTLNSMRSRDVVVIFTDGDVYDMNDAKTRALFEQVAARSSAALFMTTHTEHEITRWVTVKVTIDDM